MKIFHVPVSLLIIMFFLDSASGFVEKRHQWWEIRLRNLTTEKAQLQKNAVLDRQVLAIIDNEMNRARSMMAVFESEMKDDGSLNHEERIMTEADIASEVGRTVPPLFALNRLEALVKESAGNGSAAATVRNEVEQRLKGMIVSTFAESSPGLAGKIMDAHITREEWRNLAVEYFIGRMMTSGKTELEHATADITGRISLALKAKRNRTNAGELRALTIRLARDYFSGCGVDSAARDSAALEASWTWKRIAATLDRDFESCKKIITLMNVTGMPSRAVSPERIMYYHKNPADLEALLFRGQHPQQADRASTAAVPSNKQGGTVMLEIPALFRPAGVLEEIDKLRRGTIATLTGREDRKFFDAIGARIIAIINRHTAGTRKVFSREEEKALLLRKKDGEGLLISNEREFLGAKKEFYAAFSLMDEYGKNSLACITLVSEGKNINSGSIVEEYRYRLQRDQAYLSFASALVTECLRLSSIEDPRVHEDFSTSMLKINSLFNFIGANLGLDKNDRTRLTKRDRGSIHDLKTGFIGTVNSTKEGITGYLAQYRMKRSSATGAWKKIREGLKATIAQDEIDGLYRHMAECVELYEQFRYGEKSLYRYAELFKAFVKEARTGAPSKELEYALQMNSLMSSSEQFDSARITREFATRKYLQNEGKTSIARLAALLEFYRKNGISFKDAPEPRHMAELEGRISSAPRVRIDTWIMDEGNYQDIDKKAVKKLSLLLNRRELMSGRVKDNGGKKPIESRMTVSIREPEISLTFPRGWKEETVGEAETYMGIVKSLQSGDGDSSVKLVKIALEKGDMKDTAEEWIQKSGCRLVEKRWEKAGDIHYLWILAMDKNKNISETCSVSKDGFTVLITGKTGRDRYAKFKAQFKKIIGSLRMETL